MSIRVAYGPKSGVDSAIRSGEIPKGCLIVTNNGEKDSEYMFYSPSGEMKQITSSGKFDSEEELSQYLFANETSGRAQSEVGGRIVTLLEDGVYNAYVIQDNGDKIPFESEALISSVNLSEFKLSTEKKLSIHAISMDKVTGLSEDLAKRLKISDLETHLDNVDRIAILQLNGEALEVDPETRSVNIPLASSERLGLVASSGKQNRVFIEEEGTMRVNNINVNKLVQTAGDTLIFCCGNANT